MFPLKQFLDSPMHIFLPDWFIYFYIYLGKITPPVEGVKIKITNAVPNQKIVGTLTDESGKYSLGPLPQFDYKVEASKQGYVFEETSDGFKSNKLASILVEVEDVDGSKLDGVVISVSGGRFR